MEDFASLFVGDPAPWFRQACTTPHGDYTFDMTAGRIVVLYLFGSSTDATTQTALSAVAGRRRLFDDRRASFFGVSADAADTVRLVADLPGIRHFFDHDATVGRLYGSRGIASAERRRALWYVLDPQLRVVAVALDGPETARQVLDFVGRLADRPPAALEMPPPVLLLENVFEPSFCDRLVAVYDGSESRPSGVFTQGADGPSQAVTDTGFKRRRDCTIRDRTLVEQVQGRIVRRVVPEIRKAFQFEATQLERLILACYDSSDRGGFGAHRDNTVTATAHRRFAVSINLNDGFEGGELVFPEFGQRAYRPGQGGAIVFSCSLMHLVTPVTAGRRLACLPFVYDEPAAALKRANAVRSHASAGS